MVFYWRTSNTREGVGREGSSRWYYLAGNRQGGLAEEGIRGSRLVRRPVDAVRSAAPRLGRGPCRQPAVGSDAESNDRVGRFVADEVQRLARCSALLLASSGGGGGQTCLCRRQG